MKLADGGRREQNREGEEREEILSALLIARCAESTAAECGHRDGKKEQSNKPREAASLRAEEHPLSALKITVREASGALLL